MASRSDARPDLGGKDYRDQKGGAQPVKEAAVAFLENAASVRRGAVRMFQAASHSHEMRGPSSDIADRLEAKRAERALSPLRNRLDCVTERLRRTVEQLSPAVERARSGQGPELGP